MIRQREAAYDVVVIGGGAAGLSAALVLGRARRRVAVVDAGAPRNAPAAHMQGFLSRDGMSPADFVAAGRAEVTGYGVELIERSGAGDRARVLRSSGQWPWVDGAANPRRDRCRRRAAGDPWGPPTVGPGSPALPVLPWVGRYRRQMTSRLIRAVGCIARAVFHPARQPPSPMVCCPVWAANTMRPASSRSMPPAARAPSVSGRPATWSIRAQVITRAGAGSAAAIAINADLFHDDVERAVKAAAEG